jgi:hypothetical protein
LGQTAYTASRMQLISLAMYGKAERLPTDL